MQQYRPAPDAPCLRVTVTGPEDFVIRTKADGPPLPVFFSQSGAGYEWAVTDGLDMLLKADAPEMPVDEAPGAVASTMEFAVYSGLGLRQAWMGLTHPVHGDGWGVIFEDPWSVVAVLTAGMEYGQSPISRATPGSTATWAGSRSRGAFSFSSSKAVAIGSSLWEFALPQRPRRNSRSLSRRSSK